MSIGFNLINTVLGKNQADSIFPTKGAMNTSYQLFIDGVWREGSDGTRVPVVNPATEEAFAEVSWGTPQDADLALAAAEKALAKGGEWASWTPTRRRNRKFMYIRLRMPTYRMSNRFSTTCSKAAIRATLAVPPQAGPVL